MGHIKSTIEKGLISHLFQKCHNRYKTPFRINQCYISFTFIISKIIFCAFYVSTIVQNYLHTRLFKALYVINNSSSKFQSDAFHDIQLVTLTPTFTNIKGNINNSVSIFLFHGVNISSTVQLVPASH